MFLAASGLSLLGASALAQKRGADDCPQCGGVGLVPIPDAKPFVWVDGQPAPKPEAAVGEQHCPVCRAGGDSAELVAAAKGRFERAQSKHAEWKERIGGRLVLVMTRHAALTTQFTFAQAKSAGQAVESLTLHLKRVSRSLALVPTRLGEYEQILLWERSAWDAFRKVMEELYTPMQLGDAWSLSKGFNSYDHVVTPHLYESPQTIRQRPLTHGPVFLAARRQVHLATRWKAPIWLAEGFAAYGDHAVHKANRWWSVYDPGKTPAVGDWLADARRLTKAGSVQPWDKLLRRELRDWEPDDYYQTLGIVAFLLEAEPGKFLALLRKLAAGDDQVAALEDAYRQPLAELDRRASTWLVARRP